MKDMLAEDHTQLMQYLLGELPADIRVQVEERCMLDDAFSEQCDEAELVLVDAYVERALAPEQREHFESRYLITQDRRKAVEAAYVLNVYRTRVAKRLSPVDAITPKQKQKSDFQWVPFARRYGLHPATAALLTFFAVVFGLFIWGSVGMGMLIVIPIAPLIGIMTGTLQKILYGDSGASALLKGCVVMVLIAIPFPVTPGLFIPAGILGIVWLRARASQPK